MKILSVEYEEVYNNFYRYVERYMYPNIVVLPCTARINMIKIAYLVIIGNNGPHPSKPWMWDILGVQPGAEEYHKHISGPIICGLAIQRIKTLVTSLV